MKKVLVHFHLYYHNQIDYFIKQLQKISFCNWDLFVTYIDENQESFNKIKEIKQDATLIKVENRGYDVYPFIKVIKSINLDTYDYILKIHTKNYREDETFVGSGYSWRDELVNTLLDSKINFFANIIHLSLNPRIGMICSKKTKMAAVRENIPEDTYMLDNELEKISFKTKSRDFCAGTMFIAKASIYKFLQLINLNPEDFPYNTTTDNKGTLAHVYERLLCIAVYEKGYKIFFKKHYKEYFKDLLEFIFSIKNSNDRKHKILSLLGIKIKFKKKPNKNERKKYYSYIENGINLTNEFFVPITDKKYNNSNTVKPIAFYLPQFHAIELNDKNFGKGFTEWVNVTKAIPQFTGHYQPQLPIDIGFYDLSTDNVMHRQIELAKMYGIYGFCFHYYWFSGKRLLEKPIFNYLNNKDLDLPFMLCWANENWSKLWDGGNKEVMMEQKLEENDDERFFYDILPFFRDERYIKIDNSPVLIIYRLSLFEEDRIKLFIKNIKSLAKKEGFDDIIIIGAKTFGCHNPLQFGADKMVEFPPLEISVKEIRPKYINPNFVGRILDMKPYIENADYVKYSNDKLYKTVFPAWDNTARKAKSNASVFLSSPELYKIWLENTINWTKDNKPKEEQYVFINAWNEWAEGAHLEPDQKYGYAYLQATKETIENKN